jgi:uracil-DNA glycosylase
MTTWSEIFAPVLVLPRIVELKNFVKQERLTKKIWPLPEDVFRAFDLCSFANTKIVIIGKEPYNTPGTADGLAFSTRAALTPPMLQVIFKEIYQDLNIQYFHDITYEEFFPTNNLEKWAKYGFLLLNSSLTVEEGKPESHIGKGWELIIRAAIEALNQKPTVTLLCLWGSHARQFAEFVDPHSKIVLMEAPHPAAELVKENAGFTHCRHFSIIRDVLPTIEGKNLYKDLCLDAYFDKKHAKELVKECYPLDAEKINYYIDHDLFIHIPVNKEKYYDEMKKIETVLSTKY